MDTCGGMTACCRRGDDGLTVEISLVDGRVVMVLSSRRCCGDSGEEKKGESQEETVRCGHSPWRSEEDSGQGSFLE